MAHGLPSSSSSPGLSKTDSESGDRRLVFDIDFLAERLAAATEWARAEPRTTALELGYFGASTGAAAALVAAAGSDVGAVVSRGGRPDLAMHVLASVRAPTLFIVGGEDADVLELNRKAYDRLQGVKELRVVPGASHLFEEPGALEQVVELAKGWFERHLGAA